jgi:hypothetical protein
MIEREGVYMNMDVTYYDSNRKKTPEEIEKEREKYNYEINMEKQRRHVVKVEKTKETVLLVAITVAIITTLGLAAAHRFKEDDEYFREHAFTEKDAPYNVNITDQDEAEAEQYYQENIANQNGNQK